jgi:hypothetical protein
MVAPALAEGDAEARVVLAGHLETQQAKADEDVLSSDRARLCEQGREDAPGDYGEAELGDGEKRLTVRNRFKAAAARRGLGLVFQPTRGNMVRFRVAPAAAAEATAPAVVEPEPPPTPQPALKGRGGRGKVAAAPAG